MPQTTETAPLPSRRGVLALLGAGALAPVAVTLLRAGPGPVEADGLRFDVLGAERRTLSGHPGRGPHAAHASWPDVVRVRLQVLNLAAAAVLLSPGQFRLRVDDAVTVMPTGWRDKPAVLEGGGRRSTWIDYRAPVAAGLLALEFTPAGEPRAVAVPLVHLLGGRP